jgi:hypothetical protein
MARTITVTKTINEEMGNELFSYFVDDCEIIEDDYDIRFNDLAPEERICVLAELVEQLEQAVNEELEEIFKEAARG